VARFFRRGVSKIYWLPAVSNTAAPSSGEIAAGTDLSAQIAEIGGFKLSNDPIATPDLATTFDSQINGVDTTEESTLTFHDNDASATIRNLLAKGNAGFVMLAPYGTGTGKRAEVWPVKSTGFNDDWSMDAKSAQAMAGFAITSVPTQNSVLP
jgi:hypothetical protein